MNILIRQFLGCNHSWAVCGWGLARSFIAQGHQVDLYSTDGIKFLPHDLKNFLLGFSDNKGIHIEGNVPTKKYDLAISYTAMKNFQNYLYNGNKKIGIWCYEWAGKNILPVGFAKNYKHCDFIAAPTNFAKKIFVDSGVPEKKIKVIPHGIDTNQYQQTNKIDLKTNKRFKILVNIAQNHKRKNLPGLLEAYGRAFTKRDDVILILKGKNKIIEQSFEVSLNNCLDNFKRNYPSHAEIKIFNEFIPDISALYRSVDAVYSLSHCEGFLFPALEAIASGKLVIAPNWGGQVDFLNNTNALLVEGKETRADPTSMYWESKPNAVWFQPSIDDAAEKLKYAYHNFVILNNKIELQRKSVYERYSWDRVTKEIISL